MDIRETLSVVTKIEQLGDKCDALQQQMIDLKEGPAKKRMKRFTTIYVRLFVIAVIIASIIVVVNSYVNHSYFAEFTILIAPLIVCASPVTPGIAIPLFFILRSKIKKSEEKRTLSADEQAQYDQCEIEFAANRNELHALLKQLESSEIPSKYHYSFALQTMIEYFDTKRADTLKEAINLLELELQHRERIDAINNVSVNITYEQYYYL